MKNPALPSHPQRQVIVIRDLQIRDNLILGILLKILTLINDQLQRLEKIKGKKLT